MAVKNLSNPSHPSPATELSARERRQLLSVLRELDPAGLPENRRNNRRKVSSPLWLRRLSGSPRLPIKAALINASAHGAGLLLPIALAVGDRFVVPLRFAEGGGWLVLCEVRNCKPLPGKHFQVGVRFVDRITDDQETGQIPADWTIGESR